MSKFVVSILLLFFGSTFTLVAGILTWVVYDAEGVTLLTLGGVLVTAVALSLAYKGADLLVRWFPS